MTFFDAFSSLENKLIVIYRSNWIFIAKAANLSCIKYVLVWYFKMFLTKMENAQFTKTRSFSTLIVKNFGLWGTVRNSVSTSSKFVYFSAVYLFGSVSEKITRRIDHTRLKITTSCCASRISSEESRRMT